MISAKEIPPILYSHKRDCFHERQICSQVNHNEIFNLFVIQNLQKENLVSDSPPGAFYSFPNRYTEKPLRSCFMWPESES